MADILVLGLSARALAQSARSAGYTPLAADLFCDLDQETAERSAQIAGDLENGFLWGPTIAALDSLAQGRNPIGIVYGSGLEDRTDFLEKLGARWPLLGNSAQTVARAKDPALLAEICAQLGVPHPAWSEQPREGWLRKRIGGSGGAHVAVAPSAGGGRDYWQEPIVGEPVSALMLGCKSKALVLGFSSQWVDPSPDAPFRYGGAVQPAALSEDMHSRLAQAANAVSCELGLVGLNSVDFLVSGEDWRLVEVNPRPGATVDIFHPKAGSLFGQHVDACRGRLPSRAPVFEKAAAAAIVYARSRISTMSAIAWPEWTADRQRPGTSIEAGAPLCTVLATADTADEARRLVLQRVENMRHALETDS